MSEVMDDPVVEVKEPKAKKAEKVEKVEVKKVRLTIHSGQDAAEKGDVALAHNFKQILIQRDKEVIVDETYLEVLKNATVYSTFKDENGVERSVTVPRFSVTVSPV